MKRWNKIYTVFILCFLSGVLFFLTQRKLGEIEKSIPPMFLCIPKQVRGEAISIPQGTVDHPGETLMFGTEGRISEKMSGTVLDIRLADAVWMKAVKNLTRQKTADAFAGEKAVMICSETTAEKLGCTIGKVVAVSGVDYEVVDVFKAGAYAGDIYLNQKPAGMEVPVTALLYGNRSGRRLYEKAGKQMLASQYGISVPKGEITDLQAVRQLIGQGKWIALLLLFLPVLVLFCLTALRQWTSAYKNYRDGWKITVFHLIAGILYAAAGFFIWWLLAGKLQIPQQYIPQEGILHVQSYVERISAFYQKLGTEWGNCIFLQRIGDAGRIGGIGFGCVFLFDVLACAAVWSLFRKKEIHDNGIPR